MTTSAPIDTLDDIDPERFVCDYFARNRPCLLRGGARDWPAVERWRSDAYLRATAGHRVIAQTRSSRADNGFDHASAISPAPFSSFLDGYADDPHLYVNDARMPGALVRDIGRSPLLDGFARLESFDRRIGLFMGNGAQFAPLHYDDEDNIYVLIDGHKSFTLFDIADFDRLYPHDDLHLPDFSRVPDPHVVDVAAFPRFAEATRYDVHLRPGDMLYVPGYWWHSVRSTRRSIALSYVRCDRRTQRHVFGRLLDAGVLPLDADDRARIAALLAGHGMDPRPPVDDIFALYAWLVSRLCHALHTGEGIAAAEQAMVAARDDARAALLARVGVDPYPVIYLMQNFFRAGLGIFRDQSPAAAA